MEADGKGDLKGEQRAKKSRWKGACGRTRECQKQFIEDLRN